VLTGSWGSRSGSSYGWTYFHQGMRLDTATGLYQGRARDYSPSLCRWLQMDPAGYMDGEDLYEAESDNPDDRLDPLGLTNYSTFVGGGTVGTPTSGAIGGGSGVGGGGGNGGGAYAGPGYIDWLYFQLYTSVGNWQMAALEYEKAMAAGYSPFAAPPITVSGTGLRGGTMYAMSDGLGTTAGMNPITGPYFPHFLPPPPLNPKTPDCSTGVCKCRTPILGLPFVPLNNGYLWWGNTGCGQHGSDGLFILPGNGTGNGGPVGGDECTIITQPDGSPLTPQQVSNMRQCMCRAATSGNFYPFVDDCQTKADNCIKTNGGTVPNGEGRYGY
jgi:RHS repeat-associated protein